MSFSVKRVSRKLLNFSVTFAAYNMMYLLPLNGAKPSPEHYRPPCKHGNGTHSDLESFGVIDQEYLNGATAVGGEARREEKVPVGADSYVVGLEAAPAGGVVRDGTALGALQHHATLVVWGQQRGSKYTVNKTSSLTGLK